MKYIRNFSLLLSLLITYQIRAQDQFIESEYYNHPLAEIEAPLNTFKNAKKYQHPKDIYPESSENLSALPTSYTKLLEYILPSPDQHQGNINAGSCLYMAVTGAAEILYNMDFPLEMRLSDGLTDISERWAMNVGGSVHLEHWTTDKILLFNNYNGAILNKDYRYTKGYYYFQYGPKYNWKYGLPSNWKNKLVRMPTIEREVIYAKGDSDSIYDVAVLNDEVVEKVKRALVEKNGPVLVIYNDTEYWHVVVIVGYNDFESELADSSISCPFVRQMLPSLSYTHQSAIKKAMDQQGCGTQGVFYVRESEYFSDDFYGRVDALYDYDFSRKGEEQYYVAPYVKRSYEWLKYLGNHVISVSRPDVDQAAFGPKDD